MISPRKKEKLYLVFSDFSKIDRRNLKQMAIFFSSYNHFRPSHLQTKTITSSFCALVGFLFTKWNPYFNVSIDKSMFFRNAK